MVMIHRYHLCFALLFLFQTGTAQTVSVNRLVCENGIRPAGIEKPRPHLGWQLVSGKRGVMQSAYRILVADDSVLLLQDKGNVWDSRKVNSSQSIQQPYKGKTLQPAKTYYWKVMIWDQQQKPTAWSAISSWQM